MLDPSIPRWPRELAPVDIEPICEAPYIFGPKPGAGAPMRVINQAGLWRFRLIDVQIHGWRVNALRALLLRCIATGGDIYMPMWDWLRAPVGLSAPTPFGDRSPFSDGAMFAGVALTGAVAADVAQSYSAVPIALPDGVTLSNGAFIGIGERGYGIWSIDADAPPPVYYIWPPLREAASAGDAVELYNPIIRMQLDVQNAQQTLGRLRAARYAVETFEFVEANW